MPDASHESAAQHRGRVVMLVDNDVVNDSRVRKQAQSAAAMGWDTYLLGISTTKKVERFRLGDAKVELLPVPNVLARRGYQMRSGLSRGSLGYPTRRQADYRLQQAQMSLYDTRIRRMKLKQDAGDARSAATRLKLGVSKAALARGLARERWVGTRARATERDATGAPLDPTHPAMTALLDRVMGPRAWRVFDPHLWDFELAFRDRIDALRPDIIHANDFAMIGVGARAAVRARDAGRPAKLVYDAHEYVPGMNAAQRHPWWLPAQVANEREYIGFADAVVTVSEQLADMLAQEHGIARPTVVLNAPVVRGAARDHAAPGVRELCGLSSETPLLIYSGSMSAQRGVGIMVEALPQLPTAHVAFIVSTTEKAFIKELMDRSTQLGVEDRVHWLPYVDPEHVVEYVASADVGVHPTHHLPNHEISLATKFFEYAHARLPIVVSDVKTMGDMVRRTGHGEVFTAEDLQDYVRAVKAVLAEPAKYRAAYEATNLLEEWTWERQAEILDDVYAQLMSRGQRSSNNLA